MKKFLLASSFAFAFALAASGSAFAADMSPPAPMYKAPPPPVPVANWTGCYLDAGGGYGMWNQDESASDFGLTSGTYTTGGRGWLGRFGGGCDYQFPVSGLGSFVIGAFGDYDFMGLSSTVQTVNFTAAGGAAPAAASQENERAAWYAGARLGYLITPSVMGFVSGGWTQTRFDQRNFFDLVTGASFGQSVPATTFNGWFVGGGYEYALNFGWMPIQGLFWKTEYRFAEYNTADLPIFTTTTGVPSGGVLHDQKFVQTVTSSLVWRFNWNWPVAARY
jgi:outer membrane immunogenic protein